ncbi:PhzF family phenazine biosynthesis protein [Pseudanabaena sp. FACHB-1998]|uniref:PhzF family phenazine biosynthesis protein n=1 Tax=Pseudanabaena sp. FACHB-1998 TaxID=2692858 RepID=UPI0016815E57|nr:PhzF family phenazine biosynthesis protein [Pseudanabaena sp. FACHB-1998]MBD2176661.1 PhzF family phenazine biosynthesis protein [Pseudanabaena sp. FACHB-1998]
MKLAIAIIDAFTDRVFHGNPAATTLIAEFPEDAQMQQIAAEINLSETAFVKPLDQNHFQLRWFTPLQEVPLCGHATLAMAHYLREISAIATDIPLIFSTLSGDLQITFEDELIVMDFPAATYHNCSERSRQVLNNIFGEIPYGCLGLSEDYLAVVLESESVVQNFLPNYDLIAQLEGFGFIITAIADVDQPYDFVSRFFAPKAGIPEDPVTGSAHCSLTPYWAKRFGKPNLKAKQLSARTGELDVEDRDQRVLLKGKAVTFMYGQVSY